MSESRRELTTPQLNALRELEGGEVRVWRTRRTRVATSGRLVARNVRSGRRFGGGMVDGLIKGGLAQVVTDRQGSWLMLTDDGRAAIGVSRRELTEEERAAFDIARCPEHGIHGQREKCYVCEGPVEQVRVVPVSSEGRTGRCRVCGYPQPLDARGLLAKHGTEVRSVRERLSAAPSSSGPGDAQDVLEGVSEFLERVSAWSGSDPDEVHELSQQVDDVLAALDKPPTSSRADDRGLGSHAPDCATQRPSGPPESDERKIIDLGGPDGGRYWRVVSGPAADDPFARAAAVQARLTGSQGATVNGACVRRVLVEEIPSVVPAGPPTKEER